MDFFYENKSNICPLLTYCNDKSCLKYHPRCFSGVCIKALNGNCENKKTCRLLHLKEKELKKNLKQQTINGVFLFNLCPDAEECQLSQNECQYLHRDWIKKGKVCLKYLDDDCDDPKVCKRNHISWEQLQQKTQDEYKQYGLNPEQICEKQGCSIDCKSHSNKLDPFCISHFKGVCKSKGKCVKIHCDWENIKFINAESFVQTAVPPCTGYSENKEVKIDKKFSEKLNILFNKNLIQRLSKSIKDQNIVDIIIIMDCTGSMASWIEAIKNNIQIIIEKFKSVITNYTVRIAFVGYRDFCDKENHIVYHDFTPEVAQIRDFISKQKATGGGDEAEDVAGALDKALSLDISRHPDSLLCSFLFCDAPTHGRQYHDIESDDYKDKIPPGQLENLMKRFRKIKKNSYFSCCKITKQTDKMFKKMKEGFPELEITETTSDKISDQIVFTLMTSYTTSQLKIVQQPQGTKIIRIEANYLRHKAISPVECKNLGCPDDIDYWKNFLQQVGSNQIQGSTVLEIDSNPIQIENPQEKGMCSYVFRVFDIRNNRNLIAKLPNKVVEAFKEQYGKQKNAFLQTAPEIQLEAKRSVDVRYFSGLIAQQLANGYRRKTRRMENAPPIFYVSPIKYELSEPFNGVTNLYAETAIDLPGLWEKISNNSGYIKQDRQAYATFSHLSYEWTNSQVMVTDLQGKGGIFSDPAIQTNHDPLNKLIQDQTNYGLTGMIQFMNGQHPKCNNLCQRMKLARQQFTDDNSSRMATDNQDTAVSKTSDSARVSESTNKLAKLSPEGYVVIEKFTQKDINCICDICGNIFSISYEKYQNQVEEEFYCSYCTQEIEREDVCECCGELFKYPYLQALRLGQIPTQCDQCLRDCKQENQKCIYCNKYCEKRQIKLVLMGKKGQRLCKKAQEYFESLQCQKCLESFTYQEWPTIETYTSGKYICKAINCQK